MNAVDAVALHTYYTRRIGKRARERRERARLNGAMDGRRWTHRGGKEIGRRSGIRGECR